MNNIRDTNKERLSDNAAMTAALQDVRGQANAKLQQPEFADAYHQKQLTSVASNCAHQEGVVDGEAALRQNLENAYIAADQKVPPSKNPDADTGVKSAMNSLAAYRKKHAPDYPNQSVSAGCVKCQQSALTRAQLKDPAAAVRSQWDGKKYVSGATDCNHAVKAVYPEFGTNLDAEGIGNTMASSPSWKAVPLTDAQPGDVMYTPPPGPGEHGHVEVVRAREDNGLDTWGCRTVDSQNKNPGCGDAFFKDRYLTSPEHSYTVYRKVS